MITAILFSVFFILLLIDVPIAICLGASSVAAILAAGQKLSVVAVNTYSGISKTLLLAIPFFVLAGNILVRQRGTHIHPARLPLRLLVQF